MRQVHQKIGSGESKQFMMRPQQDKRADRIGAPPSKGHALLARERFRQDKKAVARVHETRGRGAPERQAWIDRTEPPAYRGAQYKAQAKGHPHLAERGSTLFDRSDICYIGTGCAEAG